jgi:hypothetical protein
MSLQVLLSHGLKQYIIIIVHIYSLCAECQTKFKYLKIKIAQHHAGRIIRDKKKVVNHMQLAL